MDQILVHLQRLYKKIYAIVLTQQDGEVDHYVCIRLDH